MIGEKEDIELHGYTIDGIIETEMVKFENTVKRKIEITNLSLRQHIVSVQGLKANAKKNFGNNKVYISG